MVRNADALIENFGPGTMDRLGLGWDTVHELNPRLAYLAMKGFLPGPYEHRPSLDELAQFMSGLAHMTGPPGQPLRAGASVIDIMGGVMGVSSLLAALRQRDRDGIGRKVTSALFESPAFMVAQHMAGEAAPGESTRPSRRKTGKSCSSGSPPTTTGGPSAGISAGRTCSPTRASPAMPTGSPIAPRCANPSPPLHLGTTSPRSNA